MSALINPWPLTPPAGASTTLNPSDKGAAVSLSGGNLTATNTAAGNQLVRATTSKSTGKWYIECTCVNWASFGFAGPGLAVSTISLNPTAFYPAGGSAGYAPFGQVEVNGSSPASSGSYGSGDTVAIAVDLTNHLIWCRVSPSGNWNNSSSNDPATGVGGASMTSGTYFPCIELASNGDIFTMNFGATAFSGAVPGGFAAWG